MFDCFKKAEVDGRTVEMSREHLARVSASASGAVLPLTIGNLPWDTGARQAEDKHFSERDVRNTRDPFWYKTRPVYIKHNRMWIILRYLEDLHAEKQYTVDDMEEILGIGKTANRFPGSKEWISIFLEARSTSSLLKFPKPFALNDDQVMSEIKPVANVLHDIGDRLRVTDAATRATENMDQVYVTEVGEEEGKTMVNKSKITDIEIWHPDKEIKAAKDEINRDFLLNLSASGFDLLIMQEKLQYEKEIAEMKEKNAKPAEKLCKLINCNEGDTMSCKNKSHAQENDINQVSVKEVMRNVNNNLTKPCSDIRDIKVRKRKEGRVLKKIAVPLTLSPPKAHRRAVANRAVPDQPPSFQDGI